MIKRIMMLKLFSIVTVVLMSFLMKHYSFTSFPSTSTSSLSELHMCDDDDDEFHCKLTFLMREYSFLSFIPMLGNELLFVTIITHISSSAPNRPSDWTVVCFLY